MAQMQQRVSQDRFGNDYVLKKATEIRTKDGEIIPVFKGYVELQGQLFKFEISEKKDPSRDGRNQKWVKFTHMKRRTQTNRSTAFGSRR